MRLTVMATPLLYVVNFRFFRWLFIKRYGTEPYVTWSGSRIGDPPLETFTAEGFDGELKKFAANRKIGSADFVFSIATHLAPPMLIVLAFYLFGIIED